MLGTSKTQSIEDMFEWQGFVHRVATPTMFPVVRDHESVRLKIGEALELFIRESGQVANDLATTDIASGSKMAHLLGGAPLRESPGAAMILHHRVAAADHVRAFVVLTSVDRTFATSTAAIVRAGVESFARGWWLVRSGTAAELSHKSALAVASELRVAARRGVGMRDADLTTSEALARAEESLSIAAAGRSNLRVPSYSTLAIEMLKASGTELAEATYSLLSGVAHGEVTFTTGLGANPAAKPGDLEWLELPDHNFQHYALTLFAVNMTFTNELVTAWGDETIASDWRAVVERSVALLPT